MATLFNTDHSGRPVAASEEDPARIFSVSGSTLYYGVTLDELNPDGSLEPGESVEVERPQVLWTKPKGLAKVQILTDADKPKKRSQGTT